jgi:hypothetical protein
MPEQNNQPSLDTIILNFETQLHGLLLAMRNEISVRDQKIAELTKTAQSQEPKAE